MESLQLPEDLFWNGKMEPFSPDQTIFSINSDEEDWTIENSLKLEKPFVLDSPIILDEEVAKKLIKEFDLELKNDEEGDGDDENSLDSIDSEQWSDSFVISQQPPIGNPITMVQISSSQESNDVCMNPQSHNDYIIENYSCYQQANAVTQLTPPQSPPIVTIKEDDYIIQNLMSQQEQQFHQIPAKTFDFLPVLEINDIITLDAVSSPALSPVGSDVSDVTTASNVGISISENQDVVRETQIVDEFLKIKAKDLPDNWNFDDENSSAHSCMDDDSLYTPSSPSSSVSYEDTASCSGVGKSQKSEKKRPRPYGRGIEERKSRKKEQNKNAATRYRQKKKEEMKVVLDEESILAAEHEELVKVVTEYENEIKYLKKLIKEFHQKGK